MEILEAKVLFTWVLVNIILWLVVRVQYFFYKGNLNFEYFMKDHSKIGIALMVIFVLGKWVIVSYALIRAISLFLIYINGNP